MIIILFGPQGSGKGTQARLLTDKFKLYYFEAGEFLRDLASTNEVVKTTLRDGKLVPDEELSSYIASFLDEKGLYDNILFDGFPRTVDQLTVFQDWLKDKDMVVDLVVVLNISEDETVRRLSARRQNPENGKIYNLVTDPPPSGTNPDTLVQREDDKPEAIKKRLALYTEKTVPLIEKLKKITKVVEIDGARDIDEIQKDLTKLVESLKN